MKIHRLISLSLHSQFLILETNMTERERIRLTALASCAG